MSIRRLTYLSVFITASVFLSIPSQAQAIIYVNHAATGANNGTSWTDAYMFLQDALQTAQSGDEVWVATGIYKPDQGTGIAPGDREASFDIPSGMSLYGGFSGTETTRDQRDWELNETILSGDLDGDDAGNLDPFGPERQDNSLHVVQVSVPVDQVAPLLDGFTISGGNATESPINAGGGLLITNRSHVRMHKLLFRHNFACTRGGGVSSNGTFVLSSSTFIANTAGTDLSPCSLGFGGGLYHELRSVSEQLELPRIDQVVFESNVAGAGGGLTVHHSPVLVTNSTFIENEATDGGAVHNLDINESSIPATYLNTRFLGNRVTTDTGGAMSVDDSFVAITNGLFVGNTLASSSAYGGGAISVYGGERSVLSIINSTFAFNDAPSGGALWIASTGGTEIWNSIFWGNTASDGQVLVNLMFSTQIVAQVGSSIVEGGLPSGFEDTGGVMISDPLFANPDGHDNIPSTLDDDFHLTSGSPAIDTGNMAMLPPDVYDLDRDGDHEETIPVDLDFNARVHEGGLEPGYFQVDLGPFEYDAPPVIITNEYVQELPVNSPRLRGNYPNPFNLTTTITYSIPRPGDVRLEVYDLLGKRVRLLESGFRNSGEHEATFDATVLPSGIYFYTLIANDFSQTRKLVLLR